MGIAVAVSLSKPPSELESQERVHVEAPSTRVFVRMLLPRPTEESDTVSDRPPVIVVVVPFPTMVIVPVVIARVDPENNPVIVLMTVEFLFVMVVTLGKLTVVLTVVLEVAVKPTVELPTRVMVDTQTDSALLDSTVIELVIGEGAGRPPLSPSLCDDILCMPRVLTALEL